MNLEALMSPRNVVLVGASDRNWSQRVHSNLRRFGYRGDIFPVNPNRREIWGTTCYADLSSLPEAPDHLALFLPNEDSLRLLDQGGKCGARSATLFAAGFGEGDEAAGRERAVRLKSTLDKHAMVATGPNCMGLAVGRSRFVTIPDEHLEVLEPGPVAVLTQSGALVQTFSRGITDAGLKLGYLVSLGNQTSLTFADYIDYLAIDPDLKVICCYVESVVDASRFFAAAANARSHGKHVVVIKAGGSEAARQAALSHTGALAGSLEVFDAFAADAGVIRVDFLEDAIESASFLSRCPRPKGADVAVMTNSGALKSMLTAAGDTYGITFPNLSPATVSQLQSAMPEATPGNPFDSKRTLKVEEYTACIRALHDDPAIDLVLLAEELPRVGGIDRKVANFRALDQYIAQKATKPIVAFSPVSLRETDYMQELRAELPHTAWLRDVAKTLRTIESLLPKALSPVEQTTSAQPDRAAARGQWRKRAENIKEPLALNEVKSKALLADYGLKGPREVIAGDAKEALAAADTIGFPVVLKAVSAAIPHKSDAGLVLLNCQNADAVKSGVALLQERCATLKAPLEGILVAQQIHGGVEMVLGLHRDPEMGCVVMAGMGGVWLELMNDVAFAPPGLSPERALEIIRTTKVSRLLSGYRGGPPADTQALVEGVVSLGQLALELGDIIESVDVNPFVVLPAGSGAVALDGLVILRPA